MVKWHFRAKLTAHSQDHLVSVLLKGIVTYVALSVQKASIFYLDFLWLLTIFSARDCLDEETKLHEIEQVSKVRKSQAISMQLIIVAISFFLIIHEKASWNIEKNTFLTKWKTFSCWFSPTSRHMLFDDKIPNDF